MTAISRTGMNISRFPLRAPRGTAWLKAAPAFFLACAAVCALLPGCSEESYLGMKADNQLPTVHLTSSPLEGDTTNYKVTFHWLGNDEDGTIDHYEYILLSGNPIGFDPEDTTGTGKWTKTYLTDRTFEVAADEYNDDIEINRSLYSKFVRTHTFFLRAVDDRHGVSRTVHRSFTAFTLAPTASISYPKNPHPGQGQFLSPKVVFVWECRDPIDTPWNSQAADSVRYLLHPDRYMVLENLNKHPEQFEMYWSPWKSYDAPGDSGRTTLLGDDEILEIGHMYLFAVQAMDEAGAVTSIFDPMSNVRQFLVQKPTGPLIFITEPYLGKYKFLGIDSTPRQFYLPQGFVLNFSWYADASLYGGTVASYRYGWDVEDLGNPDHWEVTAAPHHKAAPEKTFYSGIHTLYIETADNFGEKTLVQIEIIIFPTSFTKNLLWIDDFKSGEFPQTIYAMPTESQHDQFWANLCSRAEGFSPESDVYDTNEHNYRLPDMQLLWKYKNVIWTFSSEDRVDDYGQGTCWTKLIRFIPEDYISDEGKVFNYLPTYMKYGGHLWTCGKSDRSGGLAGTLNRYSRIFPCYLKCEMYGPRSGCGGDTTGVSTMAYRDYCVSVLDKVWDRFRSDPDMPLRRDDLDALVYAYRDDTDPVTVEHPDLPERLNLWSAVTRPGRFFDPAKRGFLYLELYNPDYWMTRKGIPQRSCFHPIFRMRARSWYSAVDNACIGFWVTRHENAVGNAPDCVPAKSVHFGFPFWFFNRQQVDSIADAIFREWHILFE